MFMQKEFGLPVEKQKYHKKDFPVLNRVLFWLSFLALNLWLNTALGFDTALTTLGLIYLTDALVILVLAYVVFPYLYFLRKNFSFFIITGLLALVSICIKILILHYDPEFAGESSMKSIPLVLQVQVMISFLYYAIGLLWAGIRYKRREALSLMRDIQSTKLNYLHKEINPHTLFNVLNGVHVLINSDRDKAKDLLASLSDVLRFHLYTEANTKVYLKDEIQNCINFLDLYKLKSIDFDYKFTKKGDYNAHKIYPFLYLPLVENACKYGIISSKTSFIEINLEILDDRIIFEIENSKEDVKKKSQKGGIGLDNLKQRLHLLYGNAYRLNISDKTDKFKVKLVLTKI
jgi:sensor histidine kinase YesM